MTIHEVFEEDEKFKTLFSEFEDMLFYCFGFTYSKKRGLGGLGRDDYLYKRVLMGLWDGLSLKEKERYERYFPLDLEEMKFLNRKVGKKAKKGSLWRNLESFTLFLKGFPAELMKNKLIECMERLKICVESDFESGDEESLGL